MKRILSSRILKIVAGVTIALLLVAEGACRIVGVTDFPVYVRSNTVGYSLAPNQHGVFLHKNHWYVNADGLINDKPFANKHPYTLLVGDSIVYGGNPVDYDSRIGPLASKEARQDVWSAAAGGWSLFNETAFLAEHTQIVRNADHLIFIYDNGDLLGLEQWGGEGTHPTARPISSLLYVFQKYVLKSASDLPPVSDGIVKTDGWKKVLDALIATYPGKITIILYPSKKISANAPRWRAQTQKIREYASSHADKLSVFDVATIPSWGKQMYSDSIHPNDAGRRILAHTIATMIKS